MNTEAPPNKPGHPPTPAPNLVAPGAPSSSSSNPSNNAVAGIYAYLNAAYPEASGRRAQQQQQHSRASHVKDSPLSADSLDSSLSSDLDLPDLKSLMADSKAHRGRNKSETSPPSPPASAHYPDRTSHASRKTPSATPKVATSDNPLGGCLDCFFKL